MSFYKFLLGSVPLIGIITIFIVGWYITLTYDDGYFWINVIFMGAFTYIIFIMFCNIIKDINDSKHKCVNRPRDYMQTIYGGGCPEYNKDANHRVHAAEEGK